MAGLSGHTHHAEALLAEHVSCRWLYLKTFSKDGQAGG